MFGKRNGPRAAGVARIGAQASAVALTALAPVSSPVLAAGTIPANGGTISASGWWNTSTGRPDSCDSTE
jgi:hypothetical protein